jgi:hypothetical protein
MMILRKGFASRYLTALTSVAKSMPLLLHDLIPVTFLPEAYWQSGRTHYTPWAVAIA